MSFNKYIPANTYDFFMTPNYKMLYQGDILDSTTLGLKDPENTMSPDFWLIISKSCDLVIDDSLMKTRKGNVSIIPIYKFAILTLFKHRYTKKLLESINRKIVILPLISIYNNSAINKKNINNIISDKVTRFQFLPPDGHVLKEPYIVDFDLVSQLDGFDSDTLKSILDSKKLQLMSPFREKIAQRFAFHYSSIGINDSTIKSDDYLDNLKAAYK